ncbi:MAG: RNA 2',3'-cyclic phosphodiesterase [Lentisphaerae bacterium]|nr:RNA 2',3'-cyclic phosphodiesterase [Lentisphaerota bacterium]
MTADAATDVVRAFVAIELSETVRAAMARLQARLKRSGSHVGWVPPENFHLSLAFLGDIPATAVTGLQAELVCRVSTMASLRIAFEGVGHFGSASSPRVIWAGVLAPPALMALQLGVASAARACAIALESRPYRPHVTLGRVRSGRGRDALLAAMQKDAAMPLGEQSASQVVVMQSLLGSAGAHYQVLAVVPLSGAP